MSEGRAGSEASQEEEHSASIVVVVLMVELDTGAGARYPSNPLVSTFMEQMGEGGAVEWGDGGSDPLFLRSNNDEEDEV